MKNIIIFISLITLLFIGCAGGTDPAPETLTVAELQSQVVMAVGACYRGDADACSRLPELEARLDRAVNDE